MTPGERQPATGFALRDPYPWDDLVGLAKEGEELGYGALFMPETGSRDILAALTGLAGETDRLLLGSGILPVPSRAPQLLAAAAATVQERSGGRLLLGLGTGPSGPGALERLRTTVDVVRRLLRDGEAELDGRRLRLDLVPPTPPPIWIAALGPKAVRLAGEIADGVLLNWCTPDRVRRAVEELDEGLRAAGRDRSACTVGVYVRACLDPDAMAAIAAVQAMAGQYASYPAYGRQFAAMGMGDDAEQAAAAWAAGRPEDVPERLVRAIALVGAAAEARGRLEDHRRAGADLPVVYPVVVPGGPAAASAAHTIRALAPSGEVANPR
ncbi:MAG TPA: LLM class flavin-dependent oxidoreductase [Actinomycetota bacterium]|nr:LLM class flavin-dependent oxidoreductase [Actinomycetota bacterium]